MPGSGGGLSGTSGSPSATLPSDPAAQLATCSPSSISSTWNQEKGTILPHSTWICSAILFRSGRRKMIR